MSAAKRDKMMSELPTQNKLGEWETIRVGDVFSFYKNNTLKRECLSFTEGSVKNIHYGDVLINYDCIIDLAKAKLPLIRPTFMTKAIGEYLKDGDIIIADAAEDLTVGKVCEVNNVGYGQAVAGMDTFLIRPQPNLFILKFLGYYMNIAEYHDQLTRYVQGTKICHLPRSAVMDSYIRRPPLPEQAAIAAALSDIDDLIASLEKLIEKKKAVRQGLMHDLLSGKTRLEGFSGEWERVILNNVADINPPNACQIPELFMYIDLESVSDNKIVQYKSINKSNAPSRAQRMFSKADILYQTVRPYQRNNLYVDFDAENYVASTGYAVLRALPNRINSLFLFQIVHFESFVNDVLESCTGTSYPAISPTALSKISFMLPPVIEEQIAIATVLSDMELELKSLQHKLTKYRAIKTGMMNELLTGRIRLIDDETTARDA